MSGLDDLLAGRLGPGVRRCSTEHDVGALHEAALGAGWGFAHLDAGVESMDELHTALARELGFPPYYGRNLDALHDCLRDVAPTTLLVWDDWWALASAAPRRFRAVVDVLGDAVTVLLRGDDVGQDLGPCAVVPWLGLD